MQSGVRDVPEMVKIDPATALPAGMDPGEFRQKVAAAVQYTNAALAVTQVTVTACDLRDVVIPDLRAAGEAEQAGRLTAVVKQMLTDPVGHFYLRTADGRLRLPLPGGWPFDDQPWAPTNSVLSNLDEAIELLQHVRASLVSPATGQDGDANA
jgi:hypothetical protein